MSEHLFNALEQKIDKLLSQLHELKNENSRLKENDKRLKDERKHLLDVNMMAQQKIEAMISRLRSLEQK